MKTILAGIVLILGATLPTLPLAAQDAPVAAETVKQPLTVVTPETWQVQFKGDKLMQFYTVTPSEGDAALLMFSKWPAGGTLEQIPGQVELLAKSFVGAAKGNKKIKLKTDKYTIEEIGGETFSGKFVQFEVSGGIVQVMFMVGDEQGLWSGQFTGSKERWAEALTILKGLKKGS